VGGDNIGGKSQQGIFGVDRIGHDEFLNKSRVACSPQTACRGGLTLGKSAVQPNES
jgi:hypothetical protein